MWANFPLGSNKLEKSQREMFILLSVLFNLMFFFAFGEIAVQGNEHVLEEFRFFVLFGGRARSRKEV